MNSIDYQYKATVIKVIDGDTVDLRVSLGFHAHQDIRTRLFGLDAPETSTDAGKASRQYLRSLLTFGFPVIVSTYKDPTDKYGRWLATIFLYSGENVNEALIRQGFATAKTY